MNSSSSENKNIYKVILVGDTKVGKTSYVSRLRSGKFTEERFATMGVEVSPLNLTININGTINRDLKINIWDCAGDYKFQGLRNGYYIGADGALIMFDATKPNLANINEEYKLIKRICDDIPIIVCGNKFDQGTDTTLLKIPHTLISVKSCYHLEDPLLNLIKQMAKLEDIVITNYN